MDGELIKQLRRELGARLGREVSRGTFANMLNVGMGEKMVAQWETSPTADQVKRIVEVARENGLLNLANEIEISAGVQSASTDTRKFFTNAPPQIGEKGVKGSRAHPPQRVQRLHEVVDRIIERWGDLGFEALDRTIHQISEWFQKVSDQGRGE